MATYNRAHFILETLKSITNQSFTNWECLIIDDGSKDNTAEEVERFISEDSRFIYLPRRQEYKKGIPGCRNQGLDLVKGDYVVFFDDDDIIHQDNLKINFDILSSRNARFCRYDKEPFTAKFTKIEGEKDFEITSVGVSDLERMIMGELPFASCTVMWDKECFKNQRFNEELQYAEEWELYSRILSLGYGGVSIDKVLYFNRKHPDSNTGEFWNNDPKRRNSKVKAIKLIVEGLKEKQLLNPTLVQYFLRQGFFLRSHSIINTVLKASKANRFKILLYSWGFRFYPLIRPILKLKGKFLMLIKG